MLSHNRSRSTEYNPITEKGSPSPLMLPQAPASDKDFKVVDTKSPEEGCDQLSWTLFDEKKDISLEEGCDQLSWTLFDEQKDISLEEGFDQLSWTLSDEKKDISPKEGCDQLSWTPSAEKKGLPLRRPKHVCEVRDCPSYGRWFSTPRDLSRHKMRAHDLPLNPLRTYRCFAPNCSKTEHLWRRQDYFRKHLRKEHTKEKEDGLLRRAEEWWNTQHNEGTQRRSLDQTQDSDTQSVSESQGQRTSETTFDRSMPIPSSPNRSQGQLDADFLRNHDPPSPLDNSPFNLSAVTDSIWRSLIADQIPIQTLSRIDEGARQSTTAPIAPIAPTVAGPMFLEKENLELAHQLHTQSGEACGLQQYPTFVRTLARVSPFDTGPPIQVDSDWQSPVQRVNDIDPEGVQRIIYSCKQKRSSGYGHGTITKAVRVRKPIMDAAQSTLWRVDDYIEDSPQLPSSDESSSSDERVSPQTNDTLSPENLASALHLHTGTRTQNPLTPSLASQAVKRKDVRTSHTQEMIEASTTCRNSHSTSSLRTRERSTSQSNDFDLHESEGEREFMGLAADCRSNAGFSPTSAVTADHEVIASAVAHLVQAYVLMLNLQATKYRQCVNSSKISQTQHSGSESSTAPLTRQSTCTDTSKIQKRTRQEDDEDLGDDDNSPKRRKITDDESEKRSFACPYSKYDKTRYSELNTNTREKKYRRCASSYLKDISRLKQHLYRTHKRPDSYCPRCFGTFTSQHGLEEHNRMDPPCPTLVCPFPEKMNHDQKTSIRRRGDGKDQITVWFFIYETLFPLSTKPSSPYVEVVSVEAVASFQQWYETPATVATFRENFDTRIAEAFPNTSEQMLIQMILEECLSELAWQRGPNFHISNEHERPAHPSECSSRIEGNGDTVKLSETTWSSSCASMSMGINTLALTPNQNGMTELTFPVPADRKIICGRIADGGADFATQECHRPLEIFSSSTSEVFGEMDISLPQDQRQDPFTFDMMATGQVFDYDGVPHQDILSLDPFDTEEVDASSQEARTGDETSNWKRKIRAWN